MNKTSFSVKGCFYEITPNIREQDKVRVALEGAAFYSRHGVKTMEVKSK